jgi:rod shape-determining protein MreC
MRNLFLLLWRNNFTLLFVLLQFLSLFLIVKNNRFQQVSVFNSTNKVVGSIMEVVSYVTEYMHLRENNENLARENAMLKSMLPDAFYENRIVSNLITDSARLQTYSYINARVINNSVNKRNNFITLDKGRIHGIKSEMGVISSNGVVGIVKDVSEHFCTVMSVLHKNVKISTRFKNNNYFGSVSWNGKDNSIAQFTEISKHVKFSIGDTVVTTKYSSIFPENVMIGTIKEASVDQGGNFHVIEILLSTDFENLSHVYIVNNVLKEEQILLEDKNTGQNDN